MTNSKLGPKIADGRTAEVFAWGEDQVLKLYHEGWKRPTVEHEQSQAKASEQTGYRVPLVGEIVEIDDRVGLVYQRIEGETMLVAFLKHPARLVAFSHQLADLHLEMHAKETSGIKRSKVRMGEKIDRAEVLPTEIKNAALEKLESLPDESHLLHNDFHPDNIMLTPDGPVIIDWIDATVGHPLADVARTLIMTKLAVTKEERLSRLIFRMMGRIYLRRYLRKSPYTRKDLQEWMLPVAAARLEENIPHEIEPLLGFVNRLAETQ